MGEWGAILFILGFRLNSIRMKCSTSYDQCSCYITIIWPSLQILATGICCIDLFVSVFMFNLSLSPSFLSRPQDKLRLSNNEIIDITLNSERERERERERKRESTCTLHRNINWERDGERIAARVCWILTKFN